MDRIIKLTDAKVPKSFRSKRQKSKNLNKKSTDEESKSLKKGRKRKDKNAKSKPDQQSGSSSKRGKKCHKADVTGQRSEVQIELEKLNDQLR